MVPRGSLRENARGDEDGPPNPAIPLGYNPPMSFRNQIRSPVRLALWITALALVVRVAAVLVVFGDHFYFSDERNYFAEAQRMVAGNWLGTTDWYAPGVVYFMALGQAIGLHLTGLRIAQAVLGAFAAGLSVLLGFRLFGRRTALAAGVVVALYPYLAYLAGVFYAQNAVIPILLLLLYALYRRQDGGGAWWLVLAGVCWGVGGLFMVPFLLTAPFLAVWHLLRMGNARRGIGDAVLLTVVTILTLVPVTVRNYALEHRFVFIAAMGQRSFYWANNPDIDPRSRDIERWKEVNFDRVKQEQLARGWTRAQIDSALQSRALDYVRTHPRVFVSNYLYRAGNMWDVRPKPFTQNAHTGGWKFLVAAVTSAPVIFFGLLGLLFFLPRFGELFPFYAVPVVFTAVFSLFQTTVRYRLTFEPLLILLAVAAVLRLTRRLASPPETTRQET